MVEDYYGHHDFVCSLGRRRSPVNAMVQKVNLKMFAIPKFRLDERSVIAMIYWTGRLVGTAVYDYSQLSTECIDAVRNNYMWPERELFRERPERLVLHYSWRTFCDAESSGLIWNKLPDVLHYEEY